MAPQRRGLPRTPGGEAWPPAGTPAPEWAAESVAAHAPAPSTPATPVADRGSVLVRRRTGLGQTPAALALAERVNAAVAQAPAEAPALAPTAPVATAVADAAPPVARRRGLGASAQASPAPETTSVATLDPVAPPVPAASVAPASAPAAAPAAPAKPWYRTSGGIVGGVTGLLVVIAAIVAVDRWFLFHTGAGSSFLTAFPGTTKLPKWAPVGQPLWTQWQHWLNAFFIVLIIKTGWTVRTQKKASAMWQPRGGGKKIAIELFTHLSLDVVWLVNGVVFWVLLFLTGQWIRIVPYSWDFIPNAVSAGLQYASLWSWPTEDGWTNYNSLQVLTYFATVFLAAPLAALTGFRMSPMWSAKWQRLSKIYPVELARKVHFPVMIYFVLFVIVHVVLVLSTGALRNLNHMFWGSDDPGSWAGFIVFVIGIAAIIAAWFALKPLVMQQIGSVFGKVGR